MTQETPFKLSPAVLVLFLCEKIEIFGLLKKLFKPFGGLKKLSVHSANVTVTHTKSVQFTRPCYVLREHSVEMVQYLEAGVFDDEPTNGEALFALVDASSFDILASVRRLTLTFSIEDSLLTTAKLLRFAPCSQLTSLTILLRNPGLIRTDMLPPLLTQLAVVGPTFAFLSNFSLSFDRSLCNCTRSFESLNAYKRNFLA
jgi:hypothetical protein